jgi:phosphoribosylglycinamide formyltransferase 1
VGDQAEMTRRLGVLVSGRGSNLAALIRAAREGRLAALISLVVSNVPDAQALSHARDAGIEAVVLAPRDYATREAYDRALLECLTSRALDVVCLAGFMRRLGPALCHGFGGPILNIHPSLLPAFPGREAQRQAVDHGVKVSGATVHLVTPEVDAGAIVMQRPVEVLDTDTPDSLAARILAVEHQLYPEAVQRILTRPWRMVGRRVVFDDADETLR